MTLGLFVRTQNAPRQMHARTYTFVLRSFIIETEWVWVGKGEGMVGWGGGGGDETCICRNEEHVENS